MENQKTKTMFGDIVSFLGMLIILAGLLTTFIIFPNIMIGLFVVMVGILTVSAGRYVSDDELEIL